MKTIENFEKMKLNDEQLARVTGGNAIVTGQVIMTVGGVVVDAVSDWWDSYWD